MRVSRTLLAGGLATLAVAGMVGGWIATGWPSVQAEANAVRDAPRTRAQQSVRALSAELSARLESLRAGEGERPYFHYGNLFHDPRSASEGLSVTPSPLARGPEDNLVAAHFQIGARGRVTMPTINDEVPELSEPLALADNRALLETLRGVAGELRGTGLMVASAEPERIQAQRPEQAPSQQPIQVQSIDPQVYAQNAAPNVVYQQVRKIPNPNQVRVPDGDAPIRIETGGFVWRSAVIDGTPRLIATRQVVTPDGELVQGLLIDDDAANAWLEQRNPRAALIAGSDDEAIAAPVEASGGAWQVGVDPGVEMLAAADLASSMETGFWKRLVPIALAAAICAVLIVLMVARAETLARERSKFAAAAAHELRTPLAGLQLYGDMLADGLGDPKRAGVYARRVADEAARLGRVVANVLGFTQLERGALTVEPVPGDVAEAAQRAVDRARPALEHAGVELRVDLPEELRARFDDDAVQRILSNLLDNAEKYTRDRQSRVVIVSGSAGGGFARVCVRDDGPGVEGRMASRLFSPFSRGAADDGPAGLGLGLALSRALAREQGGELSYGHADGGGAAFTLRLPS